MPRARGAAPLALAAALVGCARPPDPPEGLDDTLRWLLRESTADDATLAAGLATLLDWLAADGAALVDVTSDDATSYTLADLDADDLAALPLDARVVVDPDDGATAPRDPAGAAGVVAVAGLGCARAEFEALLLRPDQDLVYPGEFTSYERRYGAGAAAFLAGDPADAPPVRAPLTPWDPAFDADAWAAVGLTAASDVDPAPVFGGLADISPYPLDLWFRHGEYDVPGHGEVPATLSVGSNRQSAWGSSGVNGLLQSYTLDVAVPRSAATPGADGLLRVMASWSEPVGIDPDGPMALRGAVQASLDAAARLDALCAAPADPGGLPDWP